MRKLLTISFIGLLIFMVNSGFARPPISAKHPVSDEYWGTKVTEDYRWLEDFNNPEVIEWNTAQNQYTRAFLDSLPIRKTLEERLTEIYSKSSPKYSSLKYVSGKLFAIKNQPPKEQSFLVVMNSANEPESERIIVDPNAIDPDGSVTIDFYVPSLDGKYVAVSLSENGSEKGAVRVFNVDDGVSLLDLVPHVNGPTAGGSVAWNANGSGFYYTRYPHERERPDNELDFFQQVFFHKLGSSSNDDSYIIGREFPKIAEIELKTTEDGRYLLAIVSNGDGGEYAHFLMNESGRWSKISEFTDKLSDAEFGHDNALYLLSHKDASRGKILRIPLEKPLLSNASIVAAQGNTVIEGFIPTDNLLYVRGLNDCSAQIRYFDLKGNLKGEVPVDPMSSIWTLCHFAVDEILFYSESYVTPECWYHFDPATNKVAETALKVKSAVDFSDIDVKRFFAKSKDGTMVPLAIVMKKGTVLDGNNPTLLGGYGGYGISTTPSFNSTLRIWLDGGGVFAEASIRGGGEYGEDWHLAGNLTKKQNVFDDFIGCAQYLIEHKYTSPSKLAIEGGSNGGLLMGAALVQHPKLFRAVVSHVGMYDMLRAELEPNGEFNITEFGTVKDSAQFKALYDYSPYHHVENGKAYPAVLFLTGDHDGRVDPSNSRKMTARLQEATGSGLPVYLRTSSGTGHGIGSGLSEIISADADYYTFLFEFLKMDYKPKIEPPQ
jgi:prolyl oligopeptidase